MSIELNRLIELNLIEALCRLLFLVKAAAVKISDFALGAGVGGRLAQERPGCERRPSFEVMSGGVASCCAGSTVGISRCARQLGS